MLINKKEKKNKIKSKSDLKSLTSNIFLNIIIVILGIVIIYMSYAIIVKIKSNSKDTSTVEKVQAAAKIIQVEVLNGCGAAGVGDKFTNYLRDNKVDVVNVSNYSSFNIDRTMVIDRIGNMANAKKVASILGIKEENVIQQINNDYFLDVSLVIGKDFKQLKPLN